MFITCLLFADDIVLLSEYAEGLQNSLNKLNEYCNKWLLTVNINKTKVMVIDKGACLYVTLDNETLDVVKEYKYLQLLLNKSGSFVKSIENLSKRAMKATFKIKNIIHLILLSQPYICLTVSWDQLWLIVVKSGELIYWTFHMDEDQWCV